PGPDGIGRVATVAAVAPPRASLLCRRCERARSTAKPAPIGITCGAGPRVHLVLEAPGDAGERRPIRRQLHAVDVLVDGQLDVDIALERAGQVVADPWREEHVLAAAHFGLSVVSFLRPFEREVELQLQTHARSQPAVVADVEIDSVAGAVLVSTIEGRLE